MCFPGWNPTLRWCLPELRGSVGHRRGHWAVSGGLSSGGSGCWLAAKRSRVLPQLGTYRQGSHEAQAVGTTETHTRAAVLQGPDPAEDSAGMRNGLPFTHSNRAQPVRLPGVTAALHGQRPLLLGLHRTECPLPWSLGISASLHLKTQELKRPFGDAAVKSPSQRNCKSREFVGAGQEPLDLARSCLSHTVTTVGPYYRTGGVPSSHLEPRISKY